MLEIFRKENRAAFIPFVVAGDPSPEITEKMIDLLIEEGSDIIELGVPFSDALADGPVIQFSSERASHTTSSIRHVLEMVKRLRKKHPYFPFVLFTYYNPILKMGVETFARACKETGVQGVLVVDLPPEEADGYCKVQAQNQIKTVFLASPTTSPDRLRLITGTSTGFTYYVSRAGVTGVQQTLSENLSAELKVLRSVTDQGVAVGFGISTPEQAKTVANQADAVVVGSAFVRLIAMVTPENLERITEEVRSLARGLSQAIRSARSASSQK